MDEDILKPGDWLVVVDSSHCTVGLSGLWKLKGQCREFPDCWEIEGTGPYSKKTFRKATPAEISHKLGQKA